MKKQALIECVPNFSEGQDMGKIRRIVRAIASIPEVAVLNVDPGRAANRTVVTFVGPPVAVVEAAYQGIRMAADCIDMRNHKGEHPRLGATDVCPLIPLANIGMKEVVTWSKKLGKRVGGELNIPVYLYEHSASEPYRRNLAAIRSGQYEGLAEKMQQKNWQPDYGPSGFNARSGATVIGAREFLIAFNVNLNTKEVRPAKAIAADIRERGRVKKDKNGRMLSVPGLCPTLKAIGWYIEEYGCAQVSMNLTNFEVTGLHTAFEACRKQAAVYGLKVTGSELVGMVPLKAMLEAGRHFLNKRMGNKDRPTDEQLVEIAVKYLGLNELGPFAIRKKIIEYSMVDLKSF